MNKSTDETPPPTTRDLQIMTVERSEGMERESEDFCQENNNLYIPTQHNTTEPTKIKIKNMGFFPT